ncbi:MAG: hypothetical protein ACLVL7_13185 [Anaerotruncus massiliensis (ex Togo et al. 2019)]
MGLRKIAALLAARLFGGCAPQAAPMAASAAEPSASAPAGRASAEPPGSTGTRPGTGGPTGLIRPAERKDWKPCPLAEDHLTLDGEAFAAKYPADALWSSGRPAACSSTGVPPPW